MLSQRNTYRIHRRDAPRRHLSFFTACVRLCARRNADILFPPPNVPRRPHSLLARRRRRAPRGKRNAPAVDMGRCPTGGGKKTSSQKNRVGYATKRLRRAQFELPHADVIYKAVHKHVNADGTPKNQGGAGNKAREISSMEAMIRGDANQPWNEDLPGGGQHYDVFTGRHFESAEALARHQKTKQYKRDRKRVLNGPKPHEQGDAEAAAGMAPPDNGKKLNRAPVAAMIE